MSESKGWPKIARLCKNKKGDNFNIEFLEDVTIKKGDRLFARFLKTELKDLVDKGTITEDEAASRQARLDFLKYNIYDNRNAEGTVTKSTGKSAGKKVSKSDEF
jgi:hypothetical protein